MKTVINIIGGTGSGKSTLAVALVGKDGVEHVQEVTVNGKPERVKWTYFAETKSIVIGNAGSGTDAAGSLLGATKLMPAFLLSDCPAKRVLVNPVRCSRTWNVEMFQSLSNVQIVFVFFDLTLEGNLARINKRRARVKDWEMTERERNNVIQFHKRAKMVGEYAASCLRPQDRLVRLLDHHSFLAGVRKVKAVL
jgi:energy-coupling factor transporter ATP-binding protein EcfA2